MTSFIKSIYLALTVIAVLLAIAALVKAQEKCERDVVEIPAKLTRQGIWLVQVSINNKPAMMLLDTGASWSTMNSKRWNLPINYSGEFTVGTWHGGQRERLTWVSVKILRIDTTDYKDVVLQSRDLSNLEASLAERIDGILASEFMTKYARVSLDYKKHVVVLEK
jgi:predicted aspartyl protease